MRLSRVVLTRGTQEAILQGTIHIGPEKLYEMFQWDIFLAINNDYQIFFEGIRGESPEILTNENQRKIKRFFETFFDLYCSVFAEVFGMSLQNRELFYPRDAINADITFAELIRLLDKNHFRCNFLLWLFKALPREKLKKMIEEEISKKGFQKSVLINDSKEWFLDKLISRIVKWFLFRKAEPIIVDYRNKVVVSKIKEYYGSRNIFVLYGEEHINGIADLLRKDGWTVKKISYLNVADFL